MNVLVIGADGYIGGALVKTLKLRGHQVEITTQATCDLLDLPTSLPPANVVFICAAKSKIMDCESHPDAWRINVDAPPRIAKMCNGARIVYLSSEAVEVAGHTAYGLQKQFAEEKLQRVSDPIIVRFGRITDAKLEEFCDYLISLMDKRPDIYRWNMPSSKTSSLSQPVSSYLEKDDVHERGA
jgi:dTDP-4-dehydrorhamnose reductase